jgi:hypothetical protein
MLLDINLLNLTLATTLWNITKIIFGKDNYQILHHSHITNYSTTDNNNSSVSLNNSDNDTILQVFYPAGSSSPSKSPIGGIGFYSTPKEIYNATHVKLEYSVRFDETFNPVLGGKLPGLFINNGISRYGGSGGKHTNNTSCRIAWRSHFNAEAYVYLPKHIIQNTTYYNNSIQNLIYGDSLWRGQFKFDNKIWNDVTLRLKLNTFDKNNHPNMDGILELTINNQTKLLDDIIWTTQKDNRVQTIIFESFFGGSSPRAVTPNDTWSYFKNIKITRL